MSIQNCKSVYLPPCFLNVLYEMNNVRSNKWVRGRPWSALAPRPYIDYCASPSISTLQQSYTSNEM
jgi:hypothetical protein